MDSLNDWQLGLGASVWIRWVHAINNFQLLLYKKNSIFSLSSFQSTDLISNPLEIIYILTAITEMFWSFAMCAFFCECGERVSQQFNQFDDEIHRCHWYALPIQIQKMHLIFMQDTQQPIIIRGYPNIWCSREIFKMVKSCCFCINNYNEDLIAFLLDS